MSIECDRCERTINVPAEHKGDRITCPYCGDVNRVPRAEATGPRGPADVAPASAQAHAPSVPMQAASEQNVCVVRPAMFRAHPFRFLAVLLLIVGGFSLAVWTMMENGPPNWIAWPGLFIGAAGVIWWVCWWLATHWWIKLTVSNKRTIRQAGIVQRHTTEVLHDHVRSVDIQQTLLQRIFRVGTVGIDSAGQDVVEIVIDDIPDPYEVKRIIDQYRKM